MRFQPGFIALGPVSELTFVGSATSTAATITIPASAAAGDIAVLFDVAWDSSAVPTDVVPSGWTGIITTTQNAGSNDTRSRVSRKVLASGDPGTAITGMNDTDDDKVMLVFRPNGAVASLALPTWSAENTASNPDAQTVSASGVTTPLVVLGAVYAGGTSSPPSPEFSTASPAFTATVTSGRLLAGYRIYNSSPSDHSIDQNDQGNANCLLSGYIRAVP